MFAAVAVKKDAKATELVARQEPDELDHYKCTPSELPLYAPLHSRNKPKPESHPPRDSKIHTTIESGVRVVRKEVQSGYNTVTDQLKTVENYWDTAKAHTRQTIDILNEPQNVLHRSGAIAIGGLSGFIFAARGGFIKKVLYTTIGAGAVASLCYPRQAEHIGRDALLEARKGFAIAYNFAKGAKPGDDTPVEPISNFPTSLKDLQFMIYDLYDEAKDTLFPKKG